MQTLQTDGSTNEHTNGQTKNYIPLGINAGGIIKGRIPTDDLIPKNRI